MTREWVKSWRGPRISQSPLSLSCQFSARWSTKHPLQRPGVVGVPEGGLAGRLERQHHLAHHVGLALADGPVADPHGTRVGVPGQPVHRPLGQAPGAVDGIHDLEVAGVAGDGAKQPVAPEPRLVRRARLDQRVDRQRGVAEPAVAVVPVALPAEVLGQRRGRCRHDPAGLGVGHQVQGEQRAPHVVGMGDAGEIAPGHPVHGLVDRLVDQVAVGARRAQVGRQPGGRPGEHLPLVDLEVVDVAVVRGVRQARAAQDQLVGAGHGGDHRLVSVPLAAPYPRLGEPVVEADDPLVVHPDRALDSGHPSYQVDAAVPGGHHVEQGDDPGLGREGRLERCRVVDVGAADLVVTDRAQLPAAVLGVAQDRREARGVVETRQTQPVDRAVGRDQGGGVPVADHRVVLDRAAHAGRVTARTRVGP